MKPIQPSLQLKLAKQLIIALGFVNLYEDKRTFHYLKSLYRDPFSGDEKWSKDNNHPVLTRNAAIITKTVSSIVIVSEDEDISFHPETLTLYATPNYLISSLTGHDLNSITNVLGDTVIPVCEAVFKYLSEAEESLKETFKKITSMQEVIKFERLYTKLLELETVLFNGKGIYRDSFIRIYGGCNYIPHEVKNRLSFIRHLITTYKIQIPIDDLNNFISGLWDVFFIDYRTIPPVYLAEEEEA